MKQILQNLKTGQTSLTEVPCPAAKSGHLLVQTQASLISPGTERMLVEFSKGGLLAKAKAQPDKVKQVLDKIKTDGLLPTLETVFKRLDEPLPLGYCNVGRVTKVGDRRSEVRGRQRSEVRGQRSEDGRQRTEGRGRKTEDGGRKAKGFKVGDRVVSNGPHAEVVCVPGNLCAKVPDEVSDEDAAFTVVGAIGLQGIRLANPTLGEKFVVFGAGLIGLLTVQLLRACGCDVLAVDLNDSRLALAESWGAEICSAGSGDPVSVAEGWTEGVGVDGVLITASAKTDEIVHQAAEMCRKRGRIVLVGVVGLNLRRADFYEKELSFQVSCSYGPGRYDDNYERKSQDYPIGYVRWTEQRNFEAVLGMMASGRLDVFPLITDRVPFADAEKAYELIGGNKESYLGIILNYDPQITQIALKDEGPEDRGQRSEDKDQRTVRLRESKEPRAVGQGQPVIGVIGAGNFAKMTLMPALSKTGARIAYVADLNGVAAQHLARKYGAENSVTDYKEVLKDPEVNSVKGVSTWLNLPQHIVVRHHLALNDNTD